MSRLWSLYERGCFWLLLVALIGAAVIVGLIAGH